MARTCESPDGYLAEEGVSGTELRDGESSALSMVCSCRPMLFDTVEESEGSCQNEQGRIGMVYEKSLSCSRLEYSWGGRLLTLALGLRDGPVARIASVVSF